MSIDLSARKVRAYNGAFQSIGKISIERAICLIFAGKAYSVKDTETILRSVNREVAIPLVICVPGAKYVRKKTTAFLKRVMYERDNYTCVYCGNDRKQEMTLDHIIPRSRWGEVSKKRNIRYDLNSYENCVTACLYCNRNKDRKLLSELGWPEVVGKQPNDSDDFDWEGLV